MVDALATLVGDGLEVPCLDGPRRYVNLDNAASTNALRSVAARSHEFLPWYSSVHRGAGFKSRQATDAYEQARHHALAFAGRLPDSDDVAVFCRNTAEAINLLAYRLRLSPDDVVVTTVVEHHANLLPWLRACGRRFVECGPTGTFSVDDVVDALESGPAARLLAITGASNVTGWLSPLPDIIDAAHARGVEVLVDGAQLAPHAPLPAEADFVAWSGHKMYAPFGAGVLIGPRRAFSSGAPFLVGGGAVDLVDLDDVAWTDPPEREEAGSPNVLGAIALDAAMTWFDDIGWERVIAHDHALAAHLRNGLARIPGVHVLGPPLDVGTLPLATFTVEGCHHALVAARLSAEFAIGVRHGCFCAHPYLLRLLDLTPDEVAAYRAAVLRHDRRAIPGAVRASAGVGTSAADIDALLSAVAAIAGGAQPPVDYEQDPTTGDFWPLGEAAGWTSADRAAGASCARG